MDKATFIKKIGTAVKNSKNLPITVFLSEVTPDKAVTWGKNSAGNFYPVTETVTKLEAGCYSAYCGAIGGVYLHKGNLQVVGSVIEFSNNMTANIYANITKFLSNKQKFTDSKLPYRKGIMVYGDPRSGKSMTIGKIAQQFIKDQGIVIWGDHPTVVKTALQKLNQIENDTPALVIFDSIEKTLENFGTEAFVDMLDTNSNVVYLASTSYPERIPAELFTKSSRFDTIELIPELSTKDREHYITSKLPKLSGNPSTIKSWAEKTKGFSLEQIDSVLTSVLGHDNSIEETIERMKLENAKSNESSEPTGKKKVIKTFHKDKDGDIVAMVEEEADDVVFIRKD